MRFEVRHRTSYTYSDPVSISHQILRLEPRAAPRQAVLRASVNVFPPPAVEMGMLDCFGNHLRALSIEAHHNSLSIDAHSVVEVESGQVPEPSLTPPWEQAALVRERVFEGATAEVARLAFASGYTRADDAIELFARDSFTPGRPVLEAALDLNRRIYEEFTYDPAATTLSTPVDEVLATRRGVCQDFAHLMLAGLRAIGVPSRYVSGYLLTRPPEGQEKLVGADASHAWVSVWLPGGVWVDLDPTNGLIPRDEHITLAWGLDFADVSPVAGVVYGGGEQKLRVAVDVVSL